MVGVTAAGNVIILTSFVTAMVACIKAFHFGGRFLTFSMDIVSSRFYDVLVLHVMKVVIHGLKPCL